MKIKRNCFERLCEELKRPEVSILLGPRQVGKTFLMKELETYSQKSGLSTAYFNLEIPHDLVQFNRSESELFEWLTHIADVVFIDEFHYLKHASKLFKAIYDSQHKVKLVVSGSSSIEIHKHLKESLAGRRLVTKISPLTFEEYQQVNPKASKETSFKDYVVYGGLPGLIHEKSDKSKIRLLNELLETYIQKDIKSLVKEENIRAFNALLFLLAENQGQVVSLNNLSREVGLNIGTISHYIAILEATFVIYPLASYAKNLGNELKKSKKYYFYDQGIRNVLLRDFRYAERQDIGVIHETFVMHHLFWALEPNIDLKFWRTKQGAEIDFVKIVNRVPHLIEVKTTLTTMDIPKAFQQFINAYPATKMGIIYSTTLTGTTEYQSTPIEFETFW